MSRIVLITGASSGIGRATALELLRGGHTVYGGARRAESLGAVTAAGGHALAMHVTSDEDRQRAVRTVLGRQGRIDVEVVLVQPGLIRTEFGDVTAGGARELSGHGPYHDLAEGLAASTEALYREDSKASDPSVVAATIRKAVESTSPKPRYPVGYMARRLLALNRFLPARLFDRVATSQIT
jgi:short-subunit dehydrogenase